MKSKTQVLSAIQNKIMELSETDKQKIIILLNNRVSAPVETAKEIASFLSEVSGIEIEYELIFDIL